MIMPISGASFHLTQLKTPSQRKKEPTSRLKDVLRKDIEETNSTLPGSEAVVWSIHGKPRPRSTSKMLEPKAFETAMSARPFFATSIEARKSGKEVPAATKVRPSGPIGILRFSLKPASACSTIPC